VFSENVNGSSGLIIDDDQTKPVLNAFLANDIYFKNVLLSTYSTTAFISCAMVGQTT